MITLDAKNRSLDRAAWGKKAEVEFDKVLPRIRTLHALDENGVVLAEVINIQEPDNATRDGN